MTAVVGDVSPATTRGSATFWSVARAAAAWTVLAVCSAALLAAVVVPRLGGATPYTVLTGSMEPAYPPGTLVVMRPEPVEQVAIGEVVTYQLSSGEPEVVTHRVVGLGQNADGAVLRTRGDANSVDDPGWVRAEQVRGTLWYAVPHLGHLSNSLTRDKRSLVTTLVAGAMFLYGFGMLGSALRDRRAARGDR